MTKIYLVVFMNDESNYYDSVVFTNKRKATQYKRYWDARIKVDEAFRGDSTLIIEKPINNYDYTEVANKMEMKTLPY